MLSTENLLLSEKPDFLYRSADSIREDISLIRSKISEVKRSFSIRELLLGMLSDTKERKPLEWLYDLESLLGEAENAYRKLSELREELTFLEEELGEAKCKVRL
jgi:chromosome segregation ATPase